MRSSIFWFLQTMELLTYLFDTLPEDYKSRYGDSFVRFLREYAMCLDSQCLDGVDDLES